MQNAQYQPNPSLSNGSVNENPAQHQPVAPAPPASQNSTQLPTSSAPASNPAPKRKQSQKSPALSVEEAARVAAEEDKRRRNTAASARFRVKKKQREQALEKTVKDTNDRNSALEARVSQLELENQWLKNLITEKNDGTSAGEGTRSKADIAEMFSKFVASQKSKTQRSPVGPKNGVGTSA